ncbi:pentapeptide repeat-containing protein [Nonomuraea bangladeshensis]|uniref:pentapeptide repeat-containing protein n=1 Tax=Nonomuraea bangladeshensis TaxID=404385 RepID=UPI0031DA0B35
MFRLRRPPVIPPSPEELNALPAKERQELWDAHRQRPLQSITAVVTSFGVLLTDRYSKAVDLLTSPSADGRLGGIYALERLARDSPRDRLTVRNVLAAFVRNHDFCLSKPPAAQCTATFGDMMLARTAKALPTDVQAALTTAVALNGPQDGTVDFSETRFPRVSFSVRAQLAHADFSQSDLFYASFSGADLRFADFHGACLVRTNLTDANLEGANLRGADLSDAQLGNVNVKNADLRGADLRSVFGLTPAQIKSVATTDEFTRFGENPPETHQCSPQAFTGVQLHPKSGTPATSE